MGLIEISRNQSSGQGKSGGNQGSDQPLAAEGHGVLMLAGEIKRVEPKNLLKFSALSIPVIRRKVARMTTCLKAQTLSVFLASAAIANSAYCDSTFLGPSPYLSSSDAPFSTLEFEYFFLEDFEDGIFNTPGVSFTPNWIVFDFSSFRDSVDADDGIIDGSGSEGFSFLSNNQSDPLTFTFDRNALGGRLPTHVGIVWTDVGRNGGGAGPALQPVTFSAVGSSGVPLGEIGPFLVGDASITGETDEDRFFGVIDPEGILSITIHMPDLNNWEVDHLQYGLHLGLIFKDGFEIESPP
jgi:hypothetical protein